MRQLMFDLDAQGGNDALKALPIDSDAEAAQTFSLYKGTITMSPPPEPPPRLRPRVITTGGAIFKTPGLATVRRAQLMVDKHRRQQAAKRRRRRAKK